MARGDARRRGLPLAARACAARLVGIRQGSWGKEICTEPARRVRRHVLRRLDAEVGECGRVEVVAPGRRPVRRRLVLHIRHLCTDERESGRSARPCKTQLKPPRQKEAPPLTFYSRLPPRARGPFLKVCHRFFRSPRQWTGRRRLAMRMARAGGALSLRAVRLVVAGRHVRQGPSRTAPSAPSTPRSTPRSAIASGTTRSSAGSKTTRGTCCARSRRWFR